MSAPLPSVGFLGVGTIATAVFRGLRLQHPELPVHLSPRSEAASRALAAAEPLVTRHSSNAAVVAASDLVFLCMLPPQLDEAVRGLPFRAGQLVVSCVGATPLAEAQALVAPASASRMIPLPSVARTAGPLLLFQAQPQVRALVQGLGDVIETDDEAAFSAFVATSALMSTYFTLQAAVIAEMTRQGAPAEAAGAYARSLFRALAETAVLASPQDRPRLPELHETPGGLNQRIRTRLQRAGWFDQLAEAAASITNLRRAELRSE